MNEFDLIRTYFASQGLARDDVVVSLGDDAAVIAVPPDMQQVVTTDVLVAGTHFFEDTDPHSLGFKALAVSFSDLAAMAATPAWFTLNLTLPEIEHGWLERFRDGLFQLAAEYQAQLVGGDTVRGPLAIGVQAGGVIPKGKALLRSGACPHDCIYVTGNIGDAGLALLHKRGVLAAPERDAPVLLARLDYPMPRIREGMALRDVASSCIDISDGLLADLGHILQASGVGARVHVDRIPLSQAFRRNFDRAGGWETAIASGDDYELCFTVPVGKAAIVQQLSAAWACGVTHIGDIEDSLGLRLIDEQGRAREPKLQGYDHFAG
ncbi:MAG: thiamine-phosphate kinase [Acidiferrobacterales bacterium]